MHEGFLSIPHIASGLNILVEYGDEEGTETQPRVFEFCVFLLFQHCVRKQISSLLCLDKRCSIFPMSCDPPIRNADGAGTRVSNTYQRNVHLRFPWRYLP